MSAPAIVLLGPSGLDVARRVAAAIPRSKLYGRSARIPAQSDIVVYEDFASTLRDLFARWQGLKKLSRLILE